LLPLSEASGRRCRSMAWRVVVGPKKRYTSADGS
jgi:hypothetical protein